MRNTSSMYLAHKVGFLDVPLRNVSSNCPMYTMAIAGANLCPLPIAMLQICVNNRLSNLISLSSVTSRIFPYLPEDNTSLIHISMYNYYSRSEVLFVVYYLLTICSQCLLHMLSSCRRTDWNMLDQIT